jgi:hypothetical protein
MNDFVRNGEISVMTKTGWMLADAYIIDHLAIQDGLTEYIISHIGTGRIVLRSGPDCSFKDAVKVAAEIESLFDDMPHINALPDREPPSQPFTEWLKRIEPTLRAAAHNLGAEPYWVR